MDEFVNWDNAGTAAAFSFDMSAQAINNDPNHNIDLTLESVIDDDFGFFALQHFSGEHALQGEPSEPVDASSLQLPDTSLSPQDFWEIPDTPCGQCSLAGYLCKLIREGEHKGFCTSCVALGHECSFGGFVSGRLAGPTLFQPTPWPAHASGSISNEQLFESFNTSSAPDIASIPAMTTEHPTAVTSADPSILQMAALGPAKIGARLSRDSIRILRQWLSSHTRHPYPSDEEKEMLQRQTGLTKIQITNWLANARRRGKINPQRSTSPTVRGYSGPLDIPARRGTPAMENMNPLQRWVDSPPEHEPASPIAIARAVTASTTSANTSSGQASPFSHNYTDDGSNRSLHESSASSLGTSQGSSGGSFASAYSQVSKGSYGSFSSLNRGRRRRRRRNGPKHSPEEKMPLAAPLKTYQCTFCTETFKTKHDWQRHEKSLHLSLERWVCCTEGPRAPKPDTNQASCVFCGEVNPDDAHIENHNYSACQDKSLAERTFYRKDHLNQHLRLVHNVKFAEWSMKNWKVATPQIRSRCGFCGIVMDTWSIRVDHLAEHFKTGYSMADWKGDWGFEAPVLDLVENSIPPYLIHTERHSPLPYVASDPPPETPRSAYELIKLELEYFMLNRRGRDEGPPTDNELQVEACRIIFASEVLSLQGISSMHSWLRDLIMSSDDIARQAKFGPLRGQVENRLATLKINGKDNLFEACPLENRLHEFVKAKRLLGLTAMDDELQEEACKVIGRMEAVSTNPSDTVANWLVRSANSGTAWLAKFRQRAVLPRSEDITDAKRRPTNSTSIDSTIYNFSRLERELGDYVELQRALGTEMPSDADLQRQARLIIYEYEDGWNQTAADNTDWLQAFKERHRGAPETSPSTSLTSPVYDDSPSASTHPLTTSSSQDLLAPPFDKEQRRFRPFFLNDANCYRRLAKELGRFVKSTMSANNPNQHVPTDAELQHQARFLLYDDDDPWNQTAADNAEWLLRFKRDVGIIKDGPGLPDTESWSIQQGGCGFAPPYAFPQTNLAPFNDSVQVEIQPGSKTFEAQAETANKFLESFPIRYQKPARIFCSRELEDGLVTYSEKALSTTGQMPSDTSLRDRAKEVLQMDTTPADNPLLLEKFKAFMQGATKGHSHNSPTSLSTGQPSHVAAGGLTSSTPTTAPPTFLPVDMDVTISDAEINDILQDMNFEFEEDSTFGTQ